MRTFNSREDLFYQVLRDWYNQEKAHLDLCGIGRRDLSRALLREKYDEYKKQWGELDDGMVR